MYKVYCKKTSKYEEMRKVDGDYAHYLTHNLLGLSIAQFLHSPFF